MVQQCVSPLVPSLPASLWKSLKSKPSVLPPLTSSMAKVCRWHLCYPTGNTWSLTFQAYQFTGPTHPVQHGGPQRRYCLTFPGYSGFPRSRQDFNNHSVQETNTHRPVPQLGQQSLNLSQKQCFKHINIQEKGGLFKSTSIITGKWSHKKHYMHTISSLGLQQTTYQF